MTVHVWRESAIVEGHSLAILSQIFIMFAAAKLLAVVGERYKIPAVISEILAGILIGPSLLGLVHPEEWTMALAGLGAIILLFDVGLDQKLTDLMKVGWTVLLVASLGVVVPFFLGYGLLALLEHSTTESIFMGAAMVATSVGITARVLQELGVLKTVVATVILGAAVIDDIFGMIVLAVVSGLREGVNYAQIISVAGMAVGFTLFIVLVGGRVMRRVTPRVRGFAVGDPYFPLALVICLGLAVAAEKIGIAAIVGAFLAGLVFSEEELTPGLKDKIHALYEFLVPFFFVTMGMQMDVRVLGQRQILLLAALVTVLAILGKLVGCGLGAYRMGWRAATQVGVGMVPRGEVGIIVASIGLGLGTISDEIYAVVIIMVLATTLLAPPALKVLFSPRVEPAPANPPSDLL
ncbi:MAG: cation:proton antiporter [Acidobacteria bacterium]|nr:cation:proton antiporter [Acidobacteriota bacterium]